MKRYEEKDVVTHLVGKYRVNVIFSSFGMVAAMVVNDHGIATVISRFG